MRFLRKRSPMKRYTLLNLDTGEIEIYEMPEKAIHNPIFMKYYDIIKEERI